MNYRAITRYAGHVLRAEALFMLIPMFVSLYLREYNVVKGFIISIAIMVILGYSVELIKRGQRNINAKDGLVLVAICWVLLSFFGALPLWLSGEFPSYLDSLFESVSGFTTTGASILSNVETLSNGLILWRSLTQWIGGMGILVLLLAIVPSATGENTMNVMKAESPGHAPGKLVPNLRKSATILYVMYIGLTFIQIVLYLIGGMPIFDSFCNALATAGTGGFGLWNNSFGHYDSTYLEIVTTIFMILFGVNFNIYYFILIRNFKSVLKSDEFKAYFGIIFASIALITINLFGATYDSVGESIREASFQVASIITTTGFSTVDFNLWPELSKMILLLLMYVGGCAGSTSGGLKVSRIVIMIKEIKRIMFRMSHPRSYDVVKLDGKVVDKTIVHGVSAYFLTFSAIAAVSLLLLSIDNYDFTTTFSAMSACLNNIGPGFNLVGPLGNYGFFSSLSKSVLILDMLIGRLEIYPILILLAPHTWQKL